MTESVEDFEFQDPSFDPSLLEAAQAVSDEHKPPEITNPLDGPVELVAGFRRLKAGTVSEFEDVRQAWVRELNGEDEEKIARTRLKDDVNAFVRAVLEAGVERLGNQTPTKSDFDSLVLGERDYLLMEIARVTYGDEVEYRKMPCPHCEEEFDVKISLNEEIPVRRLDSIDDLEFEVRLKNDRVARVTLPTGEVSSDMAKTTTPAEANTVLIAHCVQDIRGPKGTTTISGDTDEARRLSIVDRQTLVTEMSDRMPGPRYNEVKFNHDPGCGEEIRLPITLAHLFRGL